MDALRVPEIVDLVCAKVSSTEDLAAMRGVCRQWRACASQESLLRTALEREVSDTIDARQRDGTLSVDAAGDILDALYAWSADPHSSSAPSALRVDAQWRAQYAPCSACGECVHAGAPCVECFGDTSKLS